MANYNQLANNPNLTMENLINMPNTIEPSFVDYFIAGIIMGGIFFVMVKCDVKF